MASDKPSRIPPRSSVVDIGASDGTNGIFIATLAIPSDAIRVIAAPPDTISQRNVEANTGVPPRAYLEAVRDPSFPLPVTRLGKLRIVNRAAFIAWIEKGAFGDVRKDEQDEADNELVNDNEEGAGEIVGALGLLLAPSKRKKRKSSAMR